MIGYLLDTNVISEMTRPKADANVTHWLERLPVFLLPAVGVYEIATGIWRLSPGKKREYLEDWFSDILSAGSKILAFDLDAALACARIEIEARRRGRAIEQRDLLILATAKAQGLGIATRNVSHFRGFGVTVYDPFNDVYSF